MPKAYVIADLTVTDPQKFAAHLPLSDIALDKFGGRFIVVRQSRSEVLEGSPPGSPQARTLVLEFNDYETPKSQHGDYRIKLRDQTLCGLSGSSSSYI